MQTKKQTLQKHFTISRASLGDESEKIKQTLLSLKAKKKEITTSLLLLEEVMVKLYEHNSTDRFAVRIKRFLGSVTLVISQEGSPFNPFASDELWQTESESYLRNQIFRAYKAVLDYSYLNGKNTITITIKQSEYKAMYMTFAAMILGIFFGIVLRQLPPAISSTATNVMNIIQSLFTNALAFLLVPVVLFSIITSFSIFSVDDLSRIGGKTLFWVLVTATVALVISFSVSYAFFGGSVPVFPDIFMSGSEEFSKETLSFNELLLSIVPPNILPLLNGKMLPLLFVSAFTGISISILGDKVSGIRSLCKEANTLFLKMTGTVTSYIPVVAFTAMTLLVYSSPVETILILLSYVAAVVLGIASLFLVYMLLILIKAHISPIPFLKKVGFFYWTLFALSSSSAAIPLSMETCRKKLGISDKISSFVIPLGSVVHKTGTCISVIIAVYMLGRMFGTSFNVAEMVKLGLLTFLFSLGLTGYANGLICIAMLLPTVGPGIPVSSVGFVIGVYSIVKRFQSAGNTVGNIAVALLIAKEEQELDKSVYEATE